MRFVIYKTAFKNIFNKPIMIRVQIVRDQVAISEVKAIDRTARADLGLARPLNPQKLSFPR